MKENIQTRLGAFIKHKGLTRKDFDLAVGLSNGASAKIGGTVRKSTINRISAAFPELNINWLLNNEGEMLRPATSIDVSQSTIGGSVVQGNGNKVSDIADLTKLLLAQQATIDRQLAIIERLTLQLSAHGHSSLVP